MDLRIKQYVNKLNRYKRFGFYIKSIELLAESNWMWTTLASPTKCVFNLRVVKCAMTWTMVKWAYIVIGKGIGWAYIAHDVEGCAWSPLAGVQFALLMQQSCNHASEYPVMSHKNGSLVINRLNFSLLKLYLILLRSVHRLNNIQTDPFCKSICVIRLLVLWVLSRLYHRPKCLVLYLCIYLTNTVEFSIKIIHNPRQVLYFF